MWTTGSRQLDGPGETEEYAPLAAARRVRDHDIGPFAEHTIFYGGPDGAANLTMLHSHARVRGAVEVARGLYYGGDLQHAAELVRCGDAAAADFTFYRGRVDWQPGEPWLGLGLGLGLGLAP